MSDQQTHLWTPHHNSTPAIAISSERYTRGLGWVWLAMKNYKQTGSHYTWPTQLATFSLLLELLCVSTRCLRSKITERRETPVYERGPLFMIFHYRGLACSLIIKTAHVCSNQRHSCMYHDKCHPCLYAECRPAKYQHILSKTGFMGHSCGGVGMWNIRGHSLHV